MLSMNCQTPIGIHSRFKLPNNTKELSNNGIDQGPIQSPRDSSSFRAFTQKRATEYGVTGWVRNTPDGRVEGEVQGEPDLVQKLLKDVDKGPRHAHVVKLEKGEVETLDDEESFEIRR
uniref:acylphosphatase n=1 Tax=Talaromyces marneffei PM1 TaxID=1077442 RepID=A0A093W3F2_TALMA